MRKAPADTVGKTENFFSRNVKLITFLCCLAVFLTFFGPWSVYRIREFIEEMTPVDRGMSFSDAVKLSKYGKSLSLSRLQNYDCETGTFDDGVHYSANVEDGKYFLYGVADGKTGRMLYLTMTRLSDGKSADLLTEDITAVFQ